MTISKATKDIADGILEFLKTNKLESELPKLIEYLKDRDKNSDVYVYSPKILNNIEKKSLQKMFKNLTGEDPSQFFFNQDESLIDGLKIVYKDKMWDFSVKGQLSKLAKL